MRLKIITSVFLLGILCSMTSCFLDNEGDLTIVNGSVTNSITKDIVEGVPVELLKCSSGLFLGAMCDSVETVYTNSEGKYEFSFRTERRSYYKVRLAQNIKYSSVEASFDGVTVNEGSKNEIDFHATPYTVLKVHVKADKNDNNFLKIDYNAWGCSIGWYGGTLLIDTARTNQLIDTVRYLRVLPMCDYRFTMSLCNRRGVMIQDYVYTGCHDYTEMKIFFADNIDTTRIELN